MDQYSKEQSTRLDEDEQEQEDYGGSNDDLVERLTEAYKEIFMTRTLVPMKSYKLALNDDQPVQILSSQFDPTAQFIATACSDGMINIIYQNKDFMIINLIDPKLKPGPATCVKWRPGQIADYLKNTLLATYSNGNVIYWHATSKQALFRVEEKDNQVNCADFTLDGDRFVSGGSDCKLRLYDCGKLSKTPTIFQEGSAPIHQNRIMGIKFHATDCNLLYSGGWDKTVLQWDLRQHKSTGYIYGPHVYGDSIDAKDYQLLIGQYKEEKQLEIWDTRMLSRVSTLDWLEYGKNFKELNLKKQQSKIYSCKFDKKTNFIYAASVGSLYSEVRVFDGNKCIDSNCCSLSGIQTIDHSVKSNKICYGTYEGNLGIMNIVD